jgi:mono/diheme cytochrome c family protein
MKALKVILIIIGILVVIVLAGLGYVKYGLPNIPVKDISVNITSERVARGEYLANHVMVCMDCHSVRDWNYYSGPITPGTFGAGGDKFSREMGFPGDFYAPNITPYNLKDWSDGEIYRAIVSGVNKKGDPIFPVMPYHSYGKADKEDIYSVIAYIRSLKSIEKDVPESEPDFPMSLIMNMIPQEPAHQSMPDKSDKVAYGKYLASAAACADCHTPFDKGQPVTEMMFAGGMEYELPFGTLRAPNITPDVATGIGSWTEDVWLARFASYDSIHKLERKDGLNEFNSLMPWNMYAGMEEEDLKAIFAYLQSLKPISHEVEKVTLKSDSQQAMAE